jgi:hypothetical protein
MSDVTHTPELPQQNEAVVVTVNVSSGVGIETVTMQYSVDNGANWQNVTMTLVGGLYTGSISPQPDDTFVMYRIVAVDTDGVESISASFSYRVGQVLPPPPVYGPQWHYGYLLGGPAIVLAYVGIALEYHDEERFTRIHGVMLTVAYFLTLINVLFLFQTDVSAWTALNPAYLIQPSNALLFTHSWHIWLGIVSMVLGTLALITHIGGWKTCNFGLPAVLLWTILGITGLYLGVFFRM